MALYLGNALYVQNFPTTSGGQNVPTGPAGGGLTGTYPNPVLGPTGVAAGTYGDGTTVPQVTIATDGRVTNVSNVAIIGGPPSGAAGGDLGGSFPSPSVNGLSGLPLETFSTTVDIGLGRFVPFRGLKIGPVPRTHSLLWGEYSIPSFNGNGWNLTVPIPVANCVPLNFKGSIFTLVQVVATDLEVGGAGGAYSLWLGTLWRYDQGTDNWIPHASNPNQENKFGTLGSMNFRTQAPIVNSYGFLAIELQPNQNTRDTFYSFYASVVCQ